MRILQVLPYYFPIHPGGLEKIAQTISLGLNESEGYDVVNLVSDIQKDTKEQSLLNDSATVIFLPSLDLIAGFPIPKFWKRNFRCKMKKAKEYAPDVTITHTRFFLQSMLGGICAKLRGCKRVHIEHGSGFVVGYPWYVRCCAFVFDRTFGLWIFRQCDTIITISHMHKTFIQKFTNKEPVVIYNPVDYIPQERKSQQDGIHIGFVGRLVPLKGVNLLLEALHAMQEENRICTIVGDGSERSNLEEQTRNLALENRVRFVGADDRANRLHKFDIFVNPSYQEGVPTTVVEALLAKCIVVATDVGGTREISDKSDLILCKAGDMIDLQQRLLTSFEYLNKSGLSYATVIKKFGIVQSLRKYENVIERLIEK